MKLSDIMIIAAAALALIAVIGIWQIKRHPEKAKDPDKVLENVADLNDRFNRARYQDKDGK